MYYPQSFGYLTPSPQQLRRYQEEAGLRRDANRVGVTVLVYYGLMFALQMLLVGLLTSWGMVDATAVGNAYQGIQPLAYYLMYGVTATVSAVIPTVILIRTSGSSIHELMPFGRVGGKNTLAYVAMGMAVCMFANFATERLGRNLEGIGVPMYSPPTPYDGSPLSAVLLIVCVCVVPALMEELVFRGAVLGFLRRFGDGVAILGSAGLFGLMHGNLVQIPFAFIVGLILGYLVVHTGSMLPSILLHFANNLFSCLLVIASGFLDAGVYNIISYGSVLLLFVLGALGVLYLSKKDRKLFNIPESNSQIAFSRRLSLFTGAPAVITFVVIMGIMSLITLLGGMLL